MQLEIRPCASDQEFADAFMAIGQYFAARPDTHAPRFQANLPAERMHAAFADGRIVGGAGAFPFELSTPGGRVPCAGVTVVGVYPTHRRRGVLRELMRAQIDDVHARGEPIAALWASEETIYGRFGYGLASWSGSVEAAHEYGAFAVPLERRGTMRLVAAEEAAREFPRVWDELVAARPGVFMRTPTWWQTRILSDRWSGEEQPLRFVVCELDGVTRGYAVYRHQPKFEGNVSVATLDVVEAISVDAQATAELWRYLLDIDWKAKLVASLLPPDHPLFLLAASPRRLRYRRNDALWVRVVDVRAALAARSYGSDESLVLELADAFCPWNEGRWRLEGGAVEPTDAEPDLRLDAAALGSLYLGGIGAHELARVQRVEELRAGAVDCAARVFAAAAHPWCPEIF